MEPKFSMIFLLFFLQTTTTQINTTSYIWGSNLISNPDFTLQSLPAGTINAFFNTKIVGWSCNPNCELVKTSAFFQSLNRPFNYNISENIDLDSKTSFDNISQIISLKNTS